MTTPITNEMIIIPRYLYNDALDYLPKAVVEDLIYTVTLSNHTEVSVHDINRPSNLSHDETVSLIKRHHQSKLPKSASSVPLALLILVGVITVVTGYDFAPESILLTTLVTIFSTFYLLELEQSRLHRLIIADNTLIAINAHIAYEINKKMTDELTTICDTQATTIKLYEIDLTELTTRYQSVFDYFSQCSPKETQKYVANLEDSYVTVHTHRGLQ